MKNLAPVLIVMIVMLAFVTVVNAQSKVHNPNLPKHLVFQWKINAEEVHSTWRNQDFYTTRTKDGLEIYYGQYRSLAQALSSLPELPAGVERSDVSLVPFFNQESVSAMVAMTLLGNLNEMDVMGVEIPRESISFTVYFGTYRNPVNLSELTQIDEELSFEITANYHFAYSAGVFGSVEMAQSYAEQLQADGFKYAEVNKYLNGQKVAMVDEQEIFAYLQWAE